jgi:hypothetical protein
MEHSESIGKIAEALAEFQAEVKDPARDKDNPYFKSKYVAIDGLLAAVRPILAKHGLSVIQSTGGNGQDISVTTEILHTSGEWIRTDALVLKAVKADPQGAGSAVTYGRRYSLSAALGVAWDDDDDGNAASTPPPKTKAAPKKPDKAALLKQIAEGAKKHSISADDMKIIMKRQYGKEASKDLTDAETADLAANFERYAIEMVEDEGKLMEGIA